MSGESIPYTVGPRRVGDVDSLVCDAGQAVRELEWQPKYHIKTMCKFSFQTYNLGTGQGVSVLQLLRTFEAVTNTVVPFEIQDRRNGDIVSMYAKTALAERELGWKAKYTLEQMCKCKWHGEGLHVVNKCHCTSVELYLSYLHAHTV